MRKIFIASIFVLAFCVFAIGQDDKIVDCPTVSITEQIDPAIGKREVTFSASVKSLVSGNVEYVWYTDNGTIINGQGTDTITVRANPDTNEFTPTVTVELGGLAEGCNASDSETAMIFCRPLPRLIDSFDLKDISITSERLNNLISEIEVSSTGTVSIIIYSKGESPSKSVKKKEAFIKKYLSDKKIADDRISIINSPDSEIDRIKIFIVPAGAESPLP